MSQNIKLSDHCIIDHFQAVNAGAEIPWTLKRIASTPLLYVDRKMHFTGFRGGIWRLFGIDRSDKNPNICNS